MRALPRRPGTGRRSVTKCAASVMKFGLLVSVFVATVVFVSQSSASDMRTEFPGKIIRSLSVSSSHILVGLKGQAPGTAKLFESRDRGNSWQPLNGSRPLSPEATDVQAVAAAGAEVVLAGTWKHGLFISRDGGSSFQPHGTFPSRDIRDFRVVSRTSGDVVYAATARQGVFRSLDMGKSWKAMGPNSDFFWSLSGTADGRDLFAVSLEKSIYRQVFGASSWDKIFGLDDAYALAAHATGSRLAIAAQTGAYRSQDSGATWQRVALPGREKLSSVLFLPNGEPIFGSWSNGLIGIDGETGKVRRRLPKLPVLHMAVSKDRLFLATWGKGLKIVPLETVMR